MNKKLILSMFLILCGCVNRDEVALGNIDKLLGNNFSKKLSFIDMADQWSFNGDGWAFFIYTIDYGFTKNNDCPEGMIFDLYSNMPTRPDGYGFEKNINKKEYLCYKNKKIDGLDRYIFIQKNTLIYFYTT